MKKCPECNGKLVPLKKESLFSVKRDGLIKIKDYQPVRCKRCKKEYRSINEIEKNKIIIPRKSYSSNARSIDSDIEQSEGDCKDKRI